MDKLIPSFSVENAISFFKKNIRSFKTESEDFSHILKSDDLEKFSLVKKIGEASLDGSGDLLVFTAKFNGDLSERTSKKIQFEIAKKILKMILRMVQFSYFMIKLAILDFLLLE